MQTPLPADIFNVRYISGKHVNFVRSLPFDCIKSVLVGMKRNRHVKMNLQVNFFIGENCELIKIGMSLSEGRKG